MATMQDVVRRVTIQGTAPGVDQASASLLKLASAQDAVAVATTNTEKATVSVQGKLNSLQKTLDAEYAAESKMAAIEKTLTAARNEGLISIQRETELLGLAKLKYTEAGEAAKVMGEQINSAKEFAMGLVGGLGAGAAFAGIAELPSKIMEVVHDAAGLSHVAETIGITTTQLQELQQVGLGFHVSTESIDSALERFSKNLAIAQTGTGELSKILKANHVIITGDVMKDFENYANLIEHASNAEDKNLLSTTAFGKGAAEMGLMFEDGAKGIQEAADAADRAGNILGGDALQSAKDLDAEFVQMKIQMDATFKDFAITTAPLVEGALQTITGAVNDVKFALDQVKTGNIVELAKLFTGQWLQVQTDSMIDQATQLKFTVPGTKAHDGDAANNPAMHLKPTVIPNTANDNAPTKAADQYKALTASVTNATNSLVAQQNALGQTAEQAAYLTEKQTLLNKANSDGLVLSPKQLQAIDQESQAYAEQKVKLAELTAVYDAGNEAFDTFFGDLSGNLQQGESFWDAFKDAGVSAIDGILQKAITAEATSAWQSLWSGGSDGGSGGFGSIISSLLGGGGVFGGGGSYASALSAIDAMAGGGAIAGPGSGTSDSILARVSNGEYIVNAQATSAFRPMLDAINYGGRFASGGAVETIHPIPRFAGGGYVQPANGTGGRASGAGDIVIHNHIDARGGEIGVEQKIANAVHGLLRYQIPAAIDQHARNPSRRGYWQTPPMNVGSTTA